MASDNRSTRVMSLKSRQNMRSASAIRSWTRSPLRVAATISRTPGRNCRLRGAQSAVTTVAFFPRAFRMNQSAHDEPKASPSGLTCPQIQNDSPADNAFAISTSELLKIEL